MKTLFKLVVAILVLNASVRGALAMWQYYEFKDAAQQVVLFLQRAAPEEVEASILAKATDLKVPMGPDDVTVRSDGTRMVAEGSYIQSVQFFPNYSYPVKFTFQVDAVLLGPLSPSRQK